jgi:hypothetical protein
MGIIISSLQLATTQDIYRLVVLVDKPTGEEISINKKLSEALIKLKPTRRTMQMEKCLLSVLESIPTGSTIKDIDVLFNPEYKIDVMRILIDANKKHPFKVLWSGTYENGCLIYSEEGLSDYKTYEINDYDIVCVV